MYQAERKKQTELVQLQHLHEQPSADRIDECAVPNYIQ